MKDWLIGSAIVLSMPCVAAATWFLLSLLMGPDAIGAIVSGVVAGLWFRWLLGWISKREWDKALNRKP